MATFLIGLVAPAIGQVEKPSATDLGSQAETWVGRQAFGVYMLGNKVGFGVTESKVVEFQGKPALYTWFEMQMQITMFGETSKLSSREESWNSLEGDGPVLQLQTTETQDGTKTGKVLRPGEDGWELVTTAGGREQKRSVAKPKTNLAQDIEIDRWVASGPAKGAKHDLWVTNLEKKDINQKEKLEYLGSESRIESGVSTKVYIVKMNMDGAAATVKFLNQKVFLEASMGKLMRIVAEDERIARRMDLKAVDFTKHLSVLVKKDMGEDPGAIEQLTAEISGYGEFEFPQSHRQRLEPREGKPALLRLRRDFRTEEAAALPAAEQKLWSEQQPGIESDHERIRKQARKIAGEEKDAIKVANLLQHWVHENLDATTAKNSDSALTILDQGAGDCTEHARLFVAFARSVGLPAREVGGLLYIKSGKQPMFGWHAWAEIHDGRQWVSVDPAWDQVFVDATHIRFSSGSDDLSWIGVIGSLKLRVVEFTRG